MSSIRLRRAISAGLLEGDEGNYKRGTRIKLNAPAGNGVASNKKRFFGGRGIIGCAVAL